MRNIICERIYLEIFYCIFHLFQYDVRCSVLVLIKTLWYWKYNLLKPINVTIKENIQRKIKNAAITLVYKYTWTGNWCRKSKVNIILMFWWRYSKLFSTFDYNINILETKLSSSKRSLAATKLTVTNLWNFSKFTARKIEERK